MQDNFASCVDCAFQYNIHKYDEQLLITMQMITLHNYTYLLGTTYSMHSVHSVYSALHRPGLEVSDIHFVHSILC